MPIYDNSYTNSYIRITGCIVTYNLSKANGAGNSDEKEDEIYNVRDCYTNKKYIYWNAKAPNELEFSNKILEKGLGAGRYLIVINDNGTHTEYINNNNPEFTVSFDGNSMNIVEKKVWGLYEQVDGHTEKFANIVSDIDGIRQDVGRVETTSNSIKETVSKFDQKADAIISSVGSKTKEFVNDEHRNEAYDELISLATELGLLLSNITNIYLSDLILDDEEKSKIQDSLKVLSSKKINVNKAIDRIRLICKPGEFRTKLESTQNKLNTTHSELVTDRILELVGKIESNEMDLLTDKFVSYNASINDVKNAVDDAIIETLGGTIEESMAQIKIEAGKISSEVKKKVDGSEFGLLIEQNYDSVGFAFKTAGGKTNGKYRVVIDNNGLTVNEGAIKTDALIPGANRRIILEEGYTSGSNYAMSIDANDGWDETQSRATSAIRLKLNQHTYIALSHGWDSNGNKIGYHHNFFVDNGGTSVMTLEKAQLRMKGNIRVENSGQIYVGSYRALTEYDKSNSTFPPSRHDHSYATKCAYIYPYNGAGTGEVGNSGRPFDHIEAKRIWWQDSGGHSDIKRKENIIEIQEEPDAPKFRTKAMSKPIIKKLNVNNFNSSAKTTININLEDMHNFINKDMKMYHYNYIGANEDKVFFNQIGFIANELAETKVGNVFIEKEPSINEYVFNFSSYTNIIAGALQKEIHKREELEETVNILIEEINHLKGE